MTVYGYGDHLPGGELGHFDGIPLDFRYPLRFSISGLMGSGKTFAADIIAGEFRGRWARTVWRVGFGETVRKLWMEQRGIDWHERPWPDIPTGELQALGTAASGPDGYGLVDRIWSEYGREHRGEDIIVDGGRRFAELLFLRNVGFEMIWMESPEELRLERLMYRERAHPAAVESWHELMHHPLEAEAFQAAQSLAIWSATWRNMWRPGQ